MKKIFFFSIFILVPSVAFSFFEPDLCQNGYAGSWTGACICQNSNFSNTYCNEKSTLNCQENKDCPINTYCNLTNKTSGFCFKNNTHIKVQTKKGVFILSNALMDKKSAHNFCASLNTNPAKRQDFNCNSTGVSCLDLKIFTPLKIKNGPRGFFWLEEVDKTDKAYYADFNDSTVYQTNSNNNSTMQALCIKD